MADALQIDAPGLSSTEARARLAHDGPNQLPPAAHPSALRRFADQLLHFFALMMWAAGGLAFLAGLPQLGIAIFIVIVLNAVFAFVQENRADRAAERLRVLLPRRITVRRDGRRVQIDAGEVVVGDALVLESGDRIPADATTTAAHSLLVDTSLLTGESEPTPVEPGGALFAGTFVVEGEADAVVTATGASTRLAGIARLTTMTARPTSPLTRELHRVVRAVAVIAVGVGGLFFTLSMLLGNRMSDGFVFALGVIVALVPEALLPTVTLSLAWGAEQMAKRQVLVRDLDAVETLGSTTFICTDKTGTLTGYVHQVEGERRAHGDPMEAAIDVFARRLGLDTGADRTAVAVQARFPFDPRRRRMSVVVAGELIVKGAPDAVLPLCADIDVDAATAALEAFTGRGLRVLAVAGGTLGAELPASAAEAEVDLDLFGLLAMEDPPRHDVSEAIDACRRAGIKVAMITGDHPATATAIATEVGLRRPDGLILSGHELPPDDEVLGALLYRDGIVVARVSPEEKLRIARALRGRGHVVAMTGDGSTTVPPHEADIGIAMGAFGTDVAREAADLVLLDDHFASIVAGVEQGRATFLNVRRFLTYHLTDNVAELTSFVIWALSAGRFPLALGVLQMADREVVDLPPHQDWSCRGRWNDQPDRRRCQDHRPYLRRPAGEKVGVRR